MADKVKYDDISTLPDYYIPVIDDVSVSDKKVYDAMPDFSVSMCRPLFSLGFEEYLNANKDKLEKTKIFKGKKQVYMIVHPFENEIEGYDASLDNVSVEHFNSDKIISRDFYKLWEIINMFDIIPTSDGFKSAHIYEANGGFAQCTMYYRNVFAKSTKKDKYHAVASDQPLEKLPKLTVHKTVKNFIDDVDGKLDFITADSNFVWKNENTQEQEALPVIINEICVALKNLNSGGSFVCKVYDTMTAPMSRIIYVLASMFGSVHIVKPLMSYASSAEKYIVCSKYIPKPKQLEQFVKVDELLTKNKLNLINIFPELEIPDKFKQILVKNNLLMTNRQFYYISKIIEFIDSKDYYGSVFQDYRMQQIDSTTFWINIYYPTKSDVGKSHKYLQELMKVALKNTKYEM